MATFVFRKGIDIGNLQAEQDSFLESCFVETSAYSSLACFDSENPVSLKRIIVGRTGSGKTALIRSILKSINNHDVVEAEKTIFDYVSNNAFVTDLANNKIDLKAFYKALWVHVLLVKCIDLLYSDAHNAEGISEKFIALISDFCSKDGRNKRNCLEYVEEHGKNFFNEDILTELTASIEDKVKASIGKGVLGANIEIGSAQHQRLQTNTSHFVNTELLRKQKGLIDFLKDNNNSNKQLKIVISIDDLDKSWLSSSYIRYDFINGLLEAFVEFLDVPNIKVLVSIRSDILKGVYIGNPQRQSEKDKTFLLPVEWTKQEIEEVLDKRINHLLQNKYAKKQYLGLKDIFDFDMDGIPAYDYVLSKTMLRPRDAIDFVNICFEAADGDTKINSNHLLAAEQSYYISRKQALIDEWSGLYKNIKIYLDALSCLKKEKFPIDKVFVNRKDKALFMNVVAQADSSDDLALEKAASGDLYELFKILFEVGVIGIYKNDSVIVYSSFNKPELDITDLSAAFVAHPLFKR